MRSLNFSPYTLRFYTDNPVITLKASQQGTAGEVSFPYKWIGACHSGSSARVASETGGSASGTGAG